MNQGNRAFLEQPTGTEGLYLEDAWRHRDTVLQLSTTLERWGYLPVQSPMVDYYDAFSGLVNQENARSTYRLVDREGDLLAVRSDATLFLAKQMARLVRPEKLPIRVYYTDTILRHEEREGISRNEFFQAGAELVGPTGICGEIETITLAMKLLDSILPDRCVLHVGNRRLVQVVADQLHRGNRDALLEALRVHDRERMTDLLCTCYDRSEAAALVRLLTYIGGPEELVALFRNNEKQLPEAITAGLMSEIEHLCTLVQELRKTVSATSRDDVARSDVARDEQADSASAKANSADADGARPYTAEGRVCVDPSEAGNQSYHTGVAFRAYCEGAEAAVASGGRYDSLYGHFGLSAPAVGFSIMLRRLERLAKRQSLPSVSTAQIELSGFAETLRRVEQQRAAGSRVALAFPTGELPR